MKYLLTSECTLRDSDLDWIDRFTIHWKRMVCRYNGHIWYQRSWDRATGRFVGECQRCYPHRDSIFITTLYDFFSEPQFDPPEAA